MELLILGLVCLILSRQEESRNRGTRLAWFGLFLIYAVWHMAAALGAVPAPAYPH